MIKKNNFPKLNKNIAGLVKKFRNIEISIDNKMDIDKIVKIISDLTSLISVSEASVRSYYACGCEAEWGSEVFEGGCYKYIITRMIYIITSFKGGVSVNVESLTGTYKKAHYCITINALEEKCDECAAMPARVVELKEAMRPDSLFQQAIYSHGLATGFGVNEVSSERAEENLKNLLDLVGSGKEICCSWKSQQIGGFGIFIRGEVTIASNRDLWSYVESDGSREFNPWEYDRYLISRREELDFSVWDHTEFFVKPKELIAFWAKDWFVRDVPGGRELVKKLRKMGHKVYITRCRHH